MISLSEVWDELSEWPELLFWALLGLVLFAGIVIAILWAAWHLMWALVIGIA